MAWVEAEMNGQRGRDIRSRAQLLNSNNASVNLAGQQAF